MSARPDDVISDDDKTLSEDVNLLCGEHCQKFMKKFKDLQKLSKKSFRWGPLANPPQDAPWVKLSYISNFTFSETCTEKRRIMLSLHTFLNTNYSVCVCGTYLIVKEKVGEK